MSSITAPGPVSGPRVTAWRDYDPDACALPGMCLGETYAGSPAAGAAQQLWQRGVRRVRLHEEVRLGAPADAEDAARTVQALCLVRDLTAQAVLVEWRLDLGGDEQAWQVLNHLQPPLRLTGTSAPEEALRTWREGHYLCKCLWRQGPGFLQIRDRRWGELRRFTSDEPEYREAVRLLSYGAPASAVPPGALADFRAEQLVGQVGELVWWLPYRVRRWIQEAMAI
ncbi:DUF5825 family protein [Streptomyces sp. 549]|uniref:DUF5825 family protein n=1 Tax=Streptomyces sp. 549 TaxID=3049076 RepID=UPI0024C243D3|nr:DUF5825 family protein [Streptomyces sp. 549]MDK1473920.1 DUF5825 family protein [Streptomyces sp. 549]